MGKAAVIRKGEQVKYLTCSVRQIIDPIERERGLATLAAEVQATPEQIALVREQIAEYLRQEREPRTPEPTPTRPDPAVLLAYVIDTPISDLGTEDFDRLRSGRDRYSRMSLESLRADLPQESEEVARRIKSDKYQAVALRWIKRGLSPEKAIRKAVYDKQREADVRAAVEHRESERELEQDPARTLKSRLLGW